MNGPALNVLIVDDDVELVGLLKFALASACSPSKAVTTS